MFLCIDPNNGLALYDQIVRQVKFAVAHEAVKPGQHVPSVRELARELAINPNTVARAYRQLQTDGVLEAQRGTGLVVTPGAPRRCRDDRLKLLRDRLRQVLDEAGQSQLGIPALRALVKDELGRLEKRRDEK